jgi:hypothetical protein
MPSYYGKLDINPVVSTDAEYTKRLFPATFKPYLFDGFTEVLHQRWDVPYVADEDFLDEAFGDLPTASAVWFDTEVLTSIKAVVAQNLSTEHSVTVGWASLEMGVYCFAQVRPGGLFVASEDVDPAQWIGIRCDEPDETARIEVAIWGS